MSGYKEVSYWTHWRRSRQNADFHLQDIAENVGLDLVQQQNISDSLNKSDIDLHESEVDVPHDVDIGAEGECPFQGESPQHHYVDAFDEVNDSRTFVEIDGNIGLNLVESGSDIELDNDIALALAGIFSDDQDGEREVDDDTCRLNVEEELKENLQHWAGIHRISHSALSALLKILQQFHPTLPKDPRTLLNTDVVYDIKKIAGGSYYHFGIQPGMLKKLALYKSFADKSVLKLQVNIDGLPIFKSSSGQFWPILGMIEDEEFKDPFAIGIFHGVSKPSNLGEFLQYFLEDLGSVRTEGLLFNGITYPVCLSALVCDAPARAFVKCCKGHGGYSGCEKCIQTGIYGNGKMSFPETNATLRTDVSFDEMLYEEHHVGTSPLVGFVGMVKQFPLDYMHLVCLGVVKKLLKLWFKGPLHVRMGIRKAMSISNHLVLMSSHVPREFARRPRGLSEKDRWKATEFRQFLIYTGPVCLIDVLDEELYKNFMLLSVGIHILLSPTLSVTLCGHAHKLLVLFVNHFSDLFGRNEIVYNVHGLVHLAEDAMNYGNLDHVSAFPFENYLYKIKKLVRKPEYPLQQVVRRLSEIGDVAKEGSKNESLGRQHLNGPLPQAFAAGHLYMYSQYNSIVLQLGYIATCKGNNCVVVGNDIGLVRNILVHSTNGEKFIVFEQFLHVDSFFSYPMDSSVLGIYRVRNLSSRLVTVSIAHIVKKCVLLPHHDYFVCLPLLHSC